MKYCLVCKDADAQALIVTNIYPGAIFRQQILATYVCLSFQVHAYIISSLKKDMPSVFGKEKKQKELIKGLDAL